MLYRLGLNDREIALLFWLLVLISWSLSQREIRHSAKGLVRSALTPKLAVPALLLGVNTAGLCVLGSRVGLWDTDLTKDVVVWYCGTGIVAFASAVTARDFTYVPKALLQAVEVTVLVQFLMNDLFVLPVVWEIGLQFSLAFLGVLVAVATKDDEHRAVHRLGTALVAGIGIGLITFVLVRTAQSWSSLDALQLLRQLALPIWMSVGAIPFLLAMGLISGYEQLFMRARIVREGGDLPWCLSLVLLVRLNVRLAGIHEFVRPSHWHILRSASWSEAWAQVGAELEAIDRLADSPGT